MPRFLPALCLATIAAAGACRPKPAESSRAPTTAEPQIPAGSSTSPPPQDPLHGAVEVDLKPHNGGPLGPGGCEVAPPAYPAKLERHRPAWTKQATMVARPGEDVWLADDPDGPFAGGLGLHAGDPNSRECAVKPGSARAILTTEIFLHTASGPPRSATDASMLRNVDQVEPCYAMLLDQHPYIRARPVLELTVAPAGNVSKVEFSRPSIDDEVRTCVAKKVEAWRFPKAKQASTILVSFLATSGTPEEVAALRTPTEDPYSVGYGRPRP